jgi:hypothetical protein
MRSQRGVFASIAFILAFPLAFLTGIIFGSGSEMVVHLVVTAGFFLLALAVFDFKVNRWLTWTMCVTSSVLGIIFLLQGMSFVIPNEPLRYVAFDVLGQQIEAVLVDVLVACFVGILLAASWERTRVLGIVVLGLVVAMEIARYVLLAQGISLNDIASELKLLFLAVFVWFLLESRKGRSTSEGRPTMAAAEPAAPA